MIFILVCLVAAALAAPLPPAQEGDTWAQVCCQDNDLNKSGGISFREFTKFALNLINLDRAELEKLFLTGDVDRNSELDGDECIPMRAALRKIVDEKGDSLLKKYDTDKDGKLSEDETNLLAKSEFTLPSEDTAKEFTLSDQNADKSISSGDEMSELMLNLRSRQVVNEGPKLLRFDTSGDGKVSYEEIKSEILRQTDGFTLKQVFKSIDTDKDYYLSPQEYLALVNELKILKEAGNRSAAPKIITPRDISALTGNKERHEGLTGLATGGTGSDGKKVGQASLPNRSSRTIAVAATSVQIRDKRDATYGMIRVAPSPTKHEFQFDGSPIQEEIYEETVKAKKRAYSRVRNRREADKAEDTAPPVLTPLQEIEKEKIQQLAKIENNLRGGDRAPSIDLSVTVPYDDSDFQ